MQGQYLYGEGHYNRAVGTQNGLQGSNHPVLRANWAGARAAALAGQHETVRYYPCRAAGVHPALQELGFAQESIRELLALSDEPDRSCEAVATIAHTHLTDVNRRLARLEALKSELERMIERCAGGRIEQCSIVEALADHAPRDAV